jgi:hypothetical protein
VVKSAIGDRIFTILQTNVLLTFGLVFWLQWNMAVMVLTMIPTVILGVLVEVYSAGDFCIFLVGSHVEQKSLFTFPSITILRELIQF